MDKQFAFAVILIILGFGITQIDDMFFVGIGFGTIIMGAIWIVFRIIKDIKS